jgi:hypothetical protein
VQFVTVTAEEEEIAPPEEAVLFEKVQFVAVT